MIVFKLRIARQRAEKGTQNLPLIGQLPDLRTPFGERVQRRREKASYTERPFKCSNPRQGLHFAAVISDF